MCYVCDDCDKVTKQTPLLACNEDFFNHGGSTEASTVTTTTMTTPEITETTTTDASTSSSSTTSTPLTTFSETTFDPTSSDDTTTTQFTELTTNGDETTEAPLPPTPGTAQPPESTTQAPTPPSVDGLQAVSSDLPAIRQRRSVIDTDVTYHCYSIQKTGDYSPFSLSHTLPTNVSLSPPLANNTLSTERGCLRLETQQNACVLLRQQHNETELKVCDPCSMNACNGATSLLKSSLWATLLLGVVAAALQSK